MKIVVIGGSGLIGAKLVDKLIERGHDVLAASPASGVDTVTGEGLSRALAGANVVVDASNSPSPDERAALEFFRASARNLSAAEEAAGVKHHVALSVVGTDRLLRSGYFRGKWAQEMLVRASRIPNTIVHFTQCFEFLGRIAQSSTEGKTIRLPPVPLQPVAADDVASVMAAIAAGAPMSGAIELAGPERFPLPELVQRFLSANRDARKVVVDAQAKYFGVEVNELSLLPGAKAWVGSTRFDDWLRQSKAGTPYRETKRPVATA